MCDGRRTTHVQWRTLGRDLHLVLRNQVTLT